jgi:putative copper export protein
VALIATGAEPVLTWLTGGDDRSLGAVITSMPDGWWWRPAMLAPLAVLAVIIAYPMRGRLSRASALVGAGLALMSLLGLVMTSHAAGRADSRWLAIAFNLAHQCSGALWVGGLVALVTWWRSAGDTREPLHAARFSRIALILVAIALVTGVVNTAYVYPLVERLQDKGLGSQSRSPRSTAGRWPER